MDASRTRTSAVGAVVVAVSLMFAACGDDDSADGTVERSTDDDVERSSASAGPVSSAGPPPTDGGASCDATVAGSEVTFGVYAPVTEIDPTLVNGGLVGGHEVAAVYDVLLRFDFESNEFVPHLAESLTSNDDHTVWTLTLRPDIEFSDGTPLTAEVVAESIARFFDDGVVNASGGYLSSIAETRIVDELTLAFTLEKPWAEFPMAFADEPGMIVNPDAVGDDREAFATKPPPAAGLGPYVVTRNAPGEELVLKARDDYWGGPVCIETLRFVFVPGGQATYDAFRSGELDVAFIRLPSVVQRARDDGFEGAFVHVDAGRSLAINHAKGRPGSDPRIAEAIALAIDVDALNQRVYQGAAKVGSSLIGEGSRFSSDAIETITPDPERAAELVTEAKADGFDGKLEVLCDTGAPAPDEALAIAGMLEAVGFTVDTKVVPLTDQLAAVIANNYDTACWGVSGDAANLTDTFVRNFRTGSPGNRVNSASKTMDAALDDLLAAATPDEQAEAAAAVNRVFIDEHPMLSIAAMDEGVVWQPHVTGIMPTAGSIMLFHDAALVD